MLTYFYCFYIRKKVIRESNKKELHMVSIVQMEKVSELVKAGYVIDEEVSAKEWDGAFTTPSYLKNPKDNTIVKVNINGTVEPYKPSRGTVWPGSKPRKPGM
jgi:hypothetical protein